METTVYGCSSVVPLPAPHALMALFHTMVFAFLSEVCLGALGVRVKGLDLMGRYPTSSI